MSATTIWLIVMVCIGLPLLIFIRPSRTENGEVKHFPSLWQKFRSWPNKHEALQNILDGKPADAPIDRTAKKYVYEDLEKHPNVLEEAYGMPPHTMPLPPVYKPSSYDIKPKQPKIQDRFDDLS